MEMVGLAVIVVRVEVGVDGLGCTPLFLKEGDFGVAMWGLHVENGMVLYCKPMRPSTRKLA